MNDVSLETIRLNRKEKLKKYGLDKESIEEFRKDIKNVNDTESDKLGKELYDFINKNYSETDDNLKKVTEYIIKGANLDYKEPKKGNFALIKCLVKGYIKTALLLLKGGADVNLVNNYKTNCGMTASRHGYDEILETMILLGLNINAKCKDGDNAIMSAKRHEKEKCIEVLKKYQAYLNNRNINNESIMELGNNLEFDKTIVKDLTYHQEKNNVTNEDALNLIAEAEESIKKLQLTND